MNRRRRMALAALIAVAAGTLSPSLLHAQARLRQVITRAELEAAGWTRLSELAFATRGAARSTVDGITVDGNLSGIPAWRLAPARDAVAIVLDGQPVAVTMLGVTVLDLLPISLSQLDSVVVEHAPTVVGGRIARHGVLHLHTRRDSTGLRGSAAHYSGNEVGDAGPFTFTPERTPNIDNSGPFHTGRLAFGAPSGIVDVAVRRWTDNLTDRRIAARHEAAAAPAAPELWVRQLASTAHAGLATGRGRHDLHAGVAQLRGTFFVPSVEAEQSLAIRLTFAGSSGRQLVGAVPVGYHASVSQLDARPYGAPLPATLAHARRELTGGASVEWGGGGVQLVAAASMLRSELRDAPALDRTARRGAASDAQLLLGVATAASWQPRLLASVGSGVGGTRGTLAMSARPLDHGANTIELSVSADSRAHGDDGAWIDLELLGIGHVATSSRRSAHASIAWSRLLEHAAELTIASTVREERGLRVIQPDPDGPPPAFAPTVGAPTSLTAAALTIALDLPATGEVEGGVSYRFSQALRGGDDVRDAARALSRHLLDASAVFTPFADIRVRPAVHLASRTRWTLIGPTASDDVPAVTRVDLSLEKWFLRRHLRAQVAARNLLNDAERYHARGADFRLRIYGGVTLSF